jgi:hypothetical protein
MNRKYIDHVGEDYKSPHIRMATAAKKYEHLEGGSVFSLIGQAAKIAAQAARAAAAAARASAKAVAKSAANTAKSAAKSVVKSAKNAGKELKSLPSNIKNASAFDKARGALSAVQTAHDLTSMVQGGQPITKAIWDGLTPAEQAVVDIHKWESQLPQNWRAEFAKQGGNQAAAFAVLRIMGEGPDDDISKQMDASFDGKLDKLFADGINWCNAEEECPQCVQQHGVDTRRGGRVPPANCYAHDLVSGWFWSDIGHKNAGNPGFDLCDDAGSREFTGIIAGMDACKGNKDKFNAYKGCVEAAAAAREKERNDTKEQLGIPKNQTIDPSKITQEEIAHMSAVHNQSFLVGDKLKISTNNDFNIANGFTTPADAMKGKKAQAIASYMLLNGDFTLETMQSVAPYNEWLKDDPSLFNRALVQTQTPTLFSYDTPYQITKDLIAHIGEVPGTTKTTAQYKNEARLNIAVEGIQEQIQEAKSTFESDDFLNSAKNAATFSPTTYYFQGDLAKLDGVVYEFINNKLYGDFSRTQIPDYKDATPARDFTGGFFAVGQDNRIYMWNTWQEQGAQKPIKNGVKDRHWDLIPYPPSPPDPKYWEVVQTYNSDELNEITKLGNAVMWTASTKYKIGDYVYYMNDTYVMIKEAKAGTLPTDVTAWTKVDVIDPKAYAENKANYPPWSATTTYAIGDKCFYSPNSNYYSAIAPSTGNRPPENKTLWQQVYMFTLTPEMKEDIAINQRVTTYTQAVEAAKDYVLNEVYHLDDIVQAADGEYYRLIKEKVDISGGVIAPPRPPQKTYWEKISAGEKDYKSTDTYKAGTFVNYKNITYLALKDVPAGTEPKVDNTKPASNGGVYLLNPGDYPASYTSYNSPRLADDSGPNPLYDAYWKPVEAIFEEIPDDVKQSYVETQRQMDIEATSDFDYEKDGYDEGDFVTTYDDNGIPTIWRCIKTYSIEYDNKTKYNVGDVVSKNGKGYKLMFNADAGIGIDAKSQDGKNYWDAVSDKVLLDYDVSLAPPNPTYWIDSAVKTEDAITDDLQKKAISFAYGVSDKDAKFVNVDVPVLDTKTNIYWKLSLSPQNTKDSKNNSSYNNGFKGYIPPEKWDFDTRYLEDPKEMKEGLYLYYTGPNPSYVTSNTDYSATPTYNGYPQKDGNVNVVTVPNLQYRWDMMPDLEDKTKSAQDNFENKNKWKPNKSYKVDDVVVYKTFYFRVIKDVTPGIIPFQKDGTVNTEYYDYIDKESEIQAIHEDFNSKVESEQATAEENASLQWFPSIQLANGNTRYFVYKDFQIVFNKGKYYQLQSFGTKRPGADTNTSPEPNGVYDATTLKGWGYNYFNYSWLECDIEGNLMPVTYTDYMNYASWNNGGVIVNYNNKKYVMNGHNKLIFGGSEGETFPPAPGAPTIEDGKACVAPSDKDPTWWVEVYDDMKPVYKLDLETGAILGKNDPPTKAEVAEAINPESTTVIQTQCPTMENDDEEDDSGDTHHDDVEAAKALAAAHDEWVAKGKQGPEPGVPTVGSAGGINYDELGIISKKRKYVRKNKNIRKK